MTKRLLTLFSILALTFSVAQSPDIFTIVQTSTASQLEAHLREVPYLDVRDPYGQTPLIYAISANRPLDVIRTLIRAGANVNARTLANWTPLMYAARDSITNETISLLIEMGADATVENDEGKTARILAYSNPVLSVAEIEAAFFPTSTVAESEPIEPTLQSYELQPDPDFGEVYHYDVPRAVGSPYEAIQRIGGTALTNQFMRCNPFDSFCMTEVEGRAFMIKEALGLGRAPWREVDGPDGPSHVLKIWLDQGRLYVMLIELERRKVAVSITRIE